MLWKLTIFLVFKYFSEKRVRCKFKFSVIHVIHRMSVDPIINSEFSVHRVLIVGYIHENGLNSTRRTFSTMINLTRLWTTMHNKLLLIQLILCIFKGRLNQESIDQFPKEKPNLFLCSVTSCPYSLKPTLQFWLCH